MLGAVQNVIQNAPSSSPVTEGPTVPGQISITASVNVTFELVESTD